MTLFTYLAIVVHLAVYLTDPQDGDIHSSNSHDYWLQMAYDWFILEIAFSLRKLPLPRSWSLLVSAYIQWLVLAHLWSLGSVTLTWSDPKMPMVLPEPPVASALQFNFFLCSVLLPSLSYTCCSSISSPVQLLHANSYLRYCFWRLWLKPIGIKSDSKELTIKWDIRARWPTGWLQLWILFLIVQGVLRSLGMLEQCNY